MADNKAKDAKNIDSDKKDDVKNKDKKEEEKQPETPEEQCSRLFKEALVLIAKGVQNEEKRFVLRALRHIGRIRKALSAEILAKSINFALAGSSRLDTILKYVGDVQDNMDLDKPSSSYDKALGSNEKQSSVPDMSNIHEVALFCQLLVVIFLIDNKKHDDATICVKDLIAQALQNRKRAGDEVCAKCYFFYVRVNELVGTSGAIRKELFAGLRTATLRKDEAGQAVLLNALLRNFISHNLIDQAQRLASKTVFPESSPNSEFARYLYYLGRIEAIQLDYGNSIESLQQAIRKAPEGAVGFLQSATKLCIIVKMLLGKIPDREIFRPESLRRSLKPYYELTQAVRGGDLAKFSAAIEKYGELFRQDKNYTLILRLRHNVIKTGVWMINISYSRISMAEIAQKLQLDSAEDAEYIVAKAIRDGVIDATIDHTGGFMSSNETLNVYGTTDPQDNFHQRIEFCMQTYDESLRSMRYPPNAYRSYLESSEDRRKREQEESEIAAEMDDLDEF